LNLGAGTNFGSSGKSDAPISGSLTGLSILAMGNPVGQEGASTSTTNNAQQINPIEEESSSGGLQRSNSNDSMMPSGRLRRESAESTPAATTSTNSIEQKFSDLSTQDDDADDMFGFDDFDG
jgi:hypothetical protein